MGGYPVIRPAAVVQVLPGDTVGSIAKRHGVTRQAIIQANALPAPYRLRPGCKIVVPESAVHTLQSGESVSQVARRYGVSVSAILYANSISDPDMVRAGQRIKIPVSGEQAMASYLLVTPSPVAKSSAAKKGDAYNSGIDREAERELLASARETSSARPRQKPEAGQYSGDPDAAYSPRRDSANGVGGPLLTGRPKQYASVEPTARVPSNSESSKPIASNQFIWPVNGRVISGFGARLNGLHNDGINIAATSGAPVQAADNGVVVYAGNELAGYGNLLLIKHSNGFVTAYAHNSKLLVGRGDSVRQGQVVAHVGKTGDVDLPQLHFEIRRGERAVNPKRYLQTANASL
jgi:murein DD-endopeptidase MepM/ murein hydrolase activator NlpD